VVSILFVVPDTNDANRLDGTAARAVVDGSFELDFTVDVNDITVKIVEDVPYLFTSSDSTAPCRSQHLAGLLLTRSGVRPLPSE
jgi:hypothetical protein